jgi:hypothetical protein
MTPRHPSELPAELRGTVFTASTARSHGVGPERFRGNDLAVRIHGVRADQAGDDEFRVRCRMFAVRLPAEAFFSHSSAARLLGVPIPHRLERLPFAHVTVPTPRRAPHASGLRGHSRVVLPGDVLTDADGLRMSAPVRLVCEMAPVLALPDLVAVIDHVIHDPSLLTTGELLAERFSGPDRLARHRRLRAALELADERAESRPESLVRVSCVLAGLPRPVANFEVTNPTTGRPIRFDLAWPERKVAVEYHGDHHRDRETWRRDLTRKSQMEAAGWIIVELHGDDLAAPSSIVERVRAAFSRRDLGYLPKNVPTRAE